MTSSARARLEALRFVMNEVYTLLMMAVIAAVLTAAMVMQSRVGQTFDAIVTGASNKGTWVRTTSLPIEGKLLGSHPGLDVGDRVRVRLAGVNIDRGFIDFRQM